MNRDFWKALFMRSIHAVWETAVASAPGAIVITPAMIEHFDWTTAKGVFCIFVAWALTALFSGILSAAKSMKVGMPEVALTETLYALDNDPDEDDEDDIEEVGDGTEDDEEGEE